MANHHHHHPRHGHVCCCHRQQGHRCSQSSSSGWTVTLRSLQRDCDSWSTAGGRRCEPSCRVDQQGAKSAPAPLPPASKKITCCGPGHGACSWWLTSDLCKRSRGRPSCIPENGPTQSSVNTRGRWTTSNVCLSVSLFNVFHLPVRFHTEVCFLWPGSRWWCESRCSHCSSWRS